MANRWGKNGNSDKFYSPGLLNHHGWWHELKRHLLLGRTATTNLDCILKSKDTTLPTKLHLVKAMVFPSSQSSHVRMWGLDYKGCWMLKNWCFWIVMLEKTLESTLDCKEIKPVNPKGNQIWISIGRTNAKAEAPILWPPDAKSWLTGKDSDAGRDWGQEEKGTTEDEMAGWYHWLDGLTWVWVNSGRWWWTRKPGMLQFMELQRVGHDWVTELNWTRICNAS